MKILLTVSAATLALLASGAYAGAGCNYGSPSELSAMPEKAPLMSSSEDAVTDPKLLALLQKRKQQAELESRIYNTYN